MRLRWRDWSTTTRAGCSWMGCGRHGVNHVASIVTRLPSLCDGHGVLTREAHAILACANDARAYTLRPAVPVIISWPERHTDQPILA
jgi:hypothetical protein